MIREGCEILIYLENVSKCYKNGVNALDNINLQINDGEFVYIIGPTGSGKSTLIKLLDGEEIPTAGTVSVEGIDVGKLKHRRVPYYRRNIGVVFQDFRLLKDRNVYENVAFAQRVIGVSGRKIRESVPEMLRMVGLSSKYKSFPHQLSGGEQQRVAIARALILSLIHI